MDQSSNWCGARKSFQHYIGGKRPDLVHGTLDMLILRTREASRWTELVNTTGRVMDPASAAGDE